MPLRFAIQECIPDQHYYISPGLIALYLARRPPGDEWEQYSAGFDNLFMVLKTLPSPGLALNLRVLCRLGYSTGRPPVAVLEVFQPNFPRLLLTP